MADSQDEALAVCSRPDLGKLFPAYVDGELDPQEQEEVERHLPLCPSCQDEMKFFLGLQELGESLFDED
jgi:anti-sigma factor RsiW